MDPVLNVWLLANPIMMNFCYIEEKKMIFLFERYPELLL